MMNDKRMTQVVMFNAIEDMLDGKKSYLPETKDLPSREITFDDIREFCEDRKAQVGKRASSSKSKTTDVQNEVREKILEVLVDGKKWTPTDIAKAVNVTPQRVTPQLTKLVADGIVAHAKEKKSSLYWLA